MPGKAMRTHVRGTQRTWRERDRLVGIAATPSFTDTRSPRNGDGAAGQVAWAPAAKVGVGPPASDELLIRSVRTNP